MVNGFDPDYGVHPFFVSTSRSIAGQYRPYAGLYWGNVAGVCTVTMQLFWLLTYECSPVWAGFGPLLWEGTMTVPSGLYTGGILTRTRGCSTTPATLEVVVSPP